MRALETSLQGLVPDLECRWGVDQVLATRYGRWVHTETDWQATAFYGPYVHLCGICLSFQPRTCPSFAIHFYFNNIPAGPHSGMGSSNQLNVASRELLGVASRLECYRRMCSQCMLRQGVRAQHCQCRVEEKERLAICLPAGALATLPRLAEARWPWTFTGVKP